jgi:hypothetical protein
MNNSTKLGVVATVLIASIGTSACVVHHGHPGGWSHGRWGDRHDYERSAYHNHARYNSLRDDHDRDRRVYERRASERREGYYSHDSRD